MSSETVEVIIKARNLTDGEKEYHFYRALYVFEEAMKQQNVIDFVGDNPIKKLVYVPGRVLNIVV